MNSDEFDDEDDEHADPSFVRKVRSNPISSGCKRCHQTLPAGAEHRSAEACVSALLEELAVATACDACEAPIGELCPACFVKKGVLNKAGQAAVGLYGKWLENMTGKRQTRRKGYRSSE